MPKAISTIVGAALFILILSTIIALITTLAINYINTIQTTYQQQAQLQELQAQLQQGIKGLFNATTTGTSSSINATFYNVGVIPAKLTSFILVLPNNTAIPLDQLNETATITATSPCAEITTNPTLTVFLPPACYVKIDITDLPPIQDINMSRIIAIAYVPQATQPATTAATTIVAVYYTLAQTTLPPTVITVAPTYKLQLVKRYAIAYDDFSSDPFVAGKLYLFYNTTKPIYGWTGNAIYINVSSQAQVYCRRKGSNINCTSNLGNYSYGYNYSFVALAINLTAYKSPFPELNSSIASKLYLLANITMTSGSFVTTNGNLDYYAEVDCEEYAVYTNSTDPRVDSDYYGLGGWNHTEWSSGITTSSERLAIVAYLLSVPGVDVLATSGLAGTVLTNKTVTIEAIHEYTTNNDTVCIIGVACVTTSNTYNIIAATGGFQAAVWAYANIISLISAFALVEAGGYSNVTVDWFVLTVNVTPHYINITNVPQNYTVRIYDCNGQPVANATAGPDGVAMLDVTRHAVVCPPATLIIVDSSGSEHKVVINDYMVGGDVWELIGG